MKQTQAHYAEIRHRRGDLSDSRRLLTLSGVDGDAPPSACTCASDKAPYPLRPRLGEFTEPRPQGSWAAFSSRRAFSQELLQWETTRS